MMSMIPMNYFDSFVPFMSFSGFSVPSSLLLVSVSVCTLHITHLI